MRFILVICFFVGQFVFISIGRSESVAVLPLEHGADLTDAKLHYFTDTKSKSIKAVLVLCPGANGEGDRLLTDFWRKYANDHELGLVGLSFESDVESLKTGSGYYYPNSGSGELLKTGVEKIYGEGIPLLLYGFSGGAHFVSRFVEANPNVVMAWCAYSFGWWDAVEDVSNAANAPGIIACGNQDYARHTSSFQYFLSGRKVDRPWLWVSLDETGHEQSEVLDLFVSDFFSAILAMPTGEIQPLWYDAQTKKRLNVNEMILNANFASWLPDEAVSSVWLEIHTP